MLPLLLIAAGPAAPPDAGWAFADEAARGGRSVLSYRTVELADAPAKPLHKDDKPPAGARYGAVALGSGGKHRLGVVWDAAGGSVWLDADGDGRYAAGERHAVGAKPVEVKVTIPFGGGTKAERTLLLRKRGDGLAHAVRGYTAGTVTLAGKAVAAFLTDGDADGCFDGAGADRVWLDLDADGAFDPLTEQFPLGTAISAGGTALLVRPRPDGMGAQVRERPNETGTLTVEVTRLARAEVVELAASYVSEFGELVVVRSADTPTPVPAGRYRVDSLRLKLADADGKVWRYSFSSGERAFGLSVAKGKETVHKPLAGLRLTVSVEAGAGATPGDDVRVQPDVTAGGLYLTNCEVGERFAEHGREVHAELRLTAPGSEVLDRAESGFL
jgi:hypothetical protein